MFCKEHNDLWFLREHNSTRDLADGHYSFPCGTFGETTPQISTSQSFTPPIVSPFVPSWRASDGHDPIGPGFALRMPSRPSLADQRWSEPWNHPTNIWPQLSLSIVASI